MMRGTFANVRIRNQVAPDTEGGFTTHFPTGVVESVYDASMKYQADGIHWSYLLENNTELEAVEIGLPKALCCLESKL